MSIKRYEESAYGPGDFGLEGAGDGAWVKYDDHAAEVARLNEQVLALAALAEERRKFIVNGVEFGYIRIPSVPLDKATGTYERCLLKPKFAADAILNEVRSQGVEEAIDKAIDAMVRSGAQTFGDCVVAVNSIRKGEQP